MANEKTPSAARQDHRIGLLANGASGAWHVSVDEWDTEPERWFLQIEGPLVYFYLEILAPNSIDQILQFLTQQLASYDELMIGEHGHTPVTLVRDDEFTDRFFLKIGSSDAPIVHYTLSGHDLECIVAAMEQAKEDLQTN